MYFPDSGCVRPLRHLYGYATDGKHMQAGMLLESLSPQYCIATQTRETYSNSS